MWYRLSSISIGMTLLGGTAISMLLAAVAMVGVIGVAGSVTAQAQECRAPLRCFERPLGTVAAHDGPGLERSIGSAVHAPAYR